MTQEDLIARIEAQHRAFMKLIREKKITKQWGEFTLRVVFKDGDIDKIDITDSVSIK